MPNLYVDSGRAAKRKDAKLTFLWDDGESTTRKQLPSLARRFFDCVVTLESSQEIESGHGDRGFQLGRVCEYSISHSERDVAVRALIARVIVGSVDPG